MNCPKCSQPLNDAQFCLECGKEGHEAEKLGGQLSPAQKGMRQGVKLMLLSIVLIPAYVLLAALFPANDRLVESHVSDTPFEKISQAILFTIFMCGLVRLLYAYFFERSSADDVNGKQAGQLDEASKRFALPPSHSIPVSDFGAWRTNTGEVSQPVSAAQSGQGFLEKE